MTFNVRERVQLGKNTKQMVFRGTKIMIYYLSNGKVFIFSCNPRESKNLESCSFVCTLMYFITTIIRREFKIQKSCLCVKPVKFRSAQSLGERGDRIQMSSNNDNNNNTNNTKTDETNANLIKHQCRLKAEFKIWLGIKVFRTFIDN